MPLKSARRLPRKYNRPISSGTRALAKRRRGKHREWRKEKMRRWYRRLQRTYLEWQRFIARWFLVGIIIALLFTFGFIVFSPVIRVREIIVSRTDPRLDIEQVQMALAPIFGRHPVFLSEIEIHSILMQELPDLRSVEVKKIYPSEVHVSVTLDPFVAQLGIVKPGEVIEATATGVLVDYLTDKGMYISTSAIYDEELPYLVIVDWGARPQSGEKLLSTDFLDRMRMMEQTLVHQFGQDTLIRAVYLRSQEFHLQVEAPEGSTVGKYSLWFDMKSSLEEQIGRYRTFLQTVGADAVGYYIDLRIKDRVVYK